MRSVPGAVATGYFRQFDRHQMQTLQTRSLFKLGSLCMGGFYDSRLNRWLGFDGVSEAVVYSVAVGNPQ